MSARAKVSHPISVGVILTAAAAVVGQFGVDIPQAVVAAVVTVILFVASKVAPGEVVE